MSAPENNLPEVNLSEESQVSTLHENVSESIEQTPTEESTSPKLPKFSTAAEVVDVLSDLIQQGVEVAKDEMELLKINFYKYRKSELEGAKRLFEQKIKEADELFEDIAAPLEEKFKEYYQKLKDNRTASIKAQEAEKEINLARKLEIIDKIKSMVDGQEDVSKSYNEFRKLQDEFKATKEVPQAKATEVWKSYQVAVEQFYDLLKISNEFREYDFKKNLELKTKLIEAALQLQEHVDVISAFHQLQKLHDQWREIGPVAKEIREDLWSKFKAISTEINKKHQDFFEGLRAQEQSNLAAKEALCAEVEAIDLALMKSFKDWEEKTALLKDLQTKWKQVGFAPRKNNIIVFDRFRGAIDKFFEAKAAYYQEAKDSFNENLKKKIALCEKVEVLKDSTDWKKTTDLIIAIQKEWKTIGAAPRKQSDIVWKRFVEACDDFFDKRNAALSGAKSQEKNNLELKRELLVKLQSLEGALQDDTEQTRAAIKEIMDQFNAVGHVPFKEKDAIYNEYKAILDKLFAQFRMGHATKRLDHFKAKIQHSGGSGVYRERERLMRQYDLLKSDITTYENNMGFINSSSKKAGSLVVEMEKKVEALKQELELILQKIEALDQAAQEKGE